MNMEHYIDSVSYFIRKKSGNQLARQLTYQDTEHSKNEDIMNRISQEVVSTHLANPWGPIVFGHIHCCFLIHNSNDFINAYQEHANCVGLLTKAIVSMKEENWMIPVVCTMARDLRLLALAADKQNAFKNAAKLQEGLYLPHEYLEKAAEPLMSIFRVCGNDIRTSNDRTKRVAMMNLVNQLFKIYFRVNKLHLCKPLIRALENANINECFSLAQQVTYNHYLGMKSMFDSDYKAADKLLTFAFEKCHPQSLKNKRLTLIFLIPVKMLLGTMPTIELLQKYDLMAFKPIVKAVKEGNLNDLDVALETHSDFFWKYGIYLILEKLKIIAYRNVFKKVCLIMKTHQVPVESFRVILNFLQNSNVSLEEVNCILANLIYEGKIKGYISLQHQKLVISKTNPFPPLATAS
ncbi:PCI domain-containing protein 2 [Brevipalpus obovatus]|uniref:PCI domain-containing protein 2 n=1 Tax=Brevipalpus obovatus TaxID=246614 RepID=UPI003D9F5ED8